MKLFDLTMQFLIAWGRRVSRLFARFGSEEQKVDALQRSALLRQDGADARFLFAQPDVLQVRATDEMRAQLARSGAEIFEDVQFKSFAGDDDDDDGGEERSGAGSWPFAPQLDLADGYSMQDVAEQVRAPEAWRRTRGEGVTIAIVDTGIADRLREISRLRRSSLDLDSHYAGRHWCDPEGHGSMCAAIAAGSRADGGRYDGVAPGATVLAARSTLFASDVALVYDELSRARAEGRLKGPLVVSNSYGLEDCTSANVLPIDHPYMTGILALISSGVFVCFAAGNNHTDVCKHDPYSCGPNSIWGPNSHDDVFSVGTVNRDFTNCDPMSPHVNSSRGPGEWANRTVKPDCVAPTYGEVAWGTSYRRMRWWGTSGACPQVAGAAALVLSVYPTLSPTEVADVIRDTCCLLPEGKTCVGHGLLDCRDAVERAAALSLSS
ncbi:S8 family peptidase [Bradyrhizobium sp. HKCCYLS20291]|uniref:S8 family peptidase n=1 Tax=Bradyrhizobium sp. HKCCYLS20291 TaxID=3420766 RepID=UPI003EC06081